MVAVMSYSPMWFSLRSRSPAAKVRSDWNSCRGRSEQAQSVDGGGVGPAWKATNSSRPLAILRRSRGVEARRGPGSKMVGGDSLTSHRGACCEFDRRPKYHARYGY